VGALEPKFFARFAEGIGLDAEFVRGQYDRRLWPRMRQAIAAILRTRSRDAWCERLEGSDACFAPVLSFEEAPRHRHAQARGAFVEIGGVVQPAPAPRFSRSVPGAPRRAPQVGEHSDEVLAEAGCDAAAIAALRAKGVVR
jgi:alpha-methylacyl-CoA racemase